jgi:hypothetical protein
VQNQEACQVVAQRRGALNGYLKVLDEEEADSKPEDEGENE